MAAPMDLDLDALSAPGEHLVACGEQVMELLVNPATTPAARGIAVVTHPHPVLGGSAKHKVPHALATALADQGWWVLRPNFRGVGRSSGSHDHGRGELSDLRALHEAIRRSRPQARQVWVGFSFGAYVLSHLAAQLAPKADAPSTVVLIGLPCGQVPAGRHYDTPPPTPGMRLIQGERDEAAPLNALFDWARPSGTPVTVVPGADHLFTGRLPLLRSLVLESIANAT